MQIPLLVHVTLTLAVITSATPVLNTGTGDSLSHSVHLPKGLVGSKGVGGTTHASPNTHTKAASLKTQTPQPPATPRPATTNTPMLKPKTFAIYNAAEGSPTKFPALHGVPLSLGNVETEGIFYNASQAGDPNCGWVAVAGRKLPNLTPVTPNAGPVANFPKLAGITLPWQLPPYTAAQYCAWVIYCCNKATIYPVFADHEQDFCQDFFSQSTAKTSSIVTAKLASSSKAIASSAKVSASSVKPSSVVSSIKPASSSKAAVSSSAKPSSTVSSVNPASSSKAPVSTSLVIRQAKQCRIVHQAGKLIKSSSFSKDHFISRTP
ncbi:hypothetical protein B0H17DRAFT_1128575 [Mycena rosella]|uniref:Uncharacterized protein n=1 Tax=Mycena rosella TaxID=1033263 RepID=A0AAD7DWN9_MYCRO|nr:hypothetical protein B0H17DRAFT_1128575 [Mycena rosella]